MTSQEPHHIKARVGRNIARARAEKKWTQRRVAGELNLDTRAVQRWESGYVSPSAENLQALATLLDRDPGWFYVEHDDPVAA